MGTNKNALVKDITELGFPAELGEQVAKNLGSPKAIERMRAYLDYVKPKTAELIVDEMLLFSDNYSVSRWGQSLCVKN